MLLLLFVATRVFARAAESVQGGEFAATVVVGAFGRIDENTVTDLNVLVADVTFADWTGIGEGRGLVA